MNKPECCIKEMPKMAVILRNSEKSERADCKDCKPTKEAIDL